MSAKPKLSVKFTKIFNKFATVWDQINQEDMSRIEANNFLMAMEDEDSFQTINWLLGTVAKNYPDIEQTEEMQSLLIDVFHSGAAIGIAAISHWGEQQVESGGNVIPIERVRSMPRQRRRPRNR